MAYSLQQSSTTPLDFLIVLASDHITGATGKTVSVSLCKNGGSFTAGLGSVTEKGNGLYAYNPTAAETNTLGPLLLQATASSCDPCSAIFYVVNYNPALVLPSSPPTSATYGTIRAQDIINRALLFLGVKASSETMPASDMQDGFITLNSMIEAWALEPDTMPVVVREEFDLTANQSTYTIGPAGDFDTVRPVWLTGAGLLQTQTTPNVELPRPVINDVMWQAIAMKTFSSAYFNVVYYNETFDAGLGTVQLWPVPNTTANKLVLYSKQAIRAFQSLTAQYVFPPGYVQTIIDNLTLMLSDQYGREPSARITMRAASGLSKLKRANYTIDDLVLDPAVTFMNLPPYNILADQG